ncbi:MAG: S41 family peptidase [Candidatus Daviesbacteria bacterium]|nr:S41 family peptidase [Candidatus Daviesbacteria bacterium]
MKEFLRKINLRQILILILVFILGWQLGHRELDLRWKNYQPALTIENKEPVSNVNVDFSLFWKTWDLVSRTHLEKSSIDPQKLFYGAISGMVSAIGDPYTVFLPPEEQKSSKEDLNGAFEGVGIQLGFNKDKRLVVIAPLDGTPAKQAGVKAEDIIIKIDDEDTINMTLPEAVKLIRGPKGSKVVLTIIRDGDEEPKDFELTRDTILVKSVEVEYKLTENNKNIAIIKLSRFAERTKQEWEEGVADILDNNPDGLILDLRNNPGGFLEGAVFIGSEFLKDGNVVLQEDSEGKRINFPVERGGKLTEIEMVALINKGSASASEIVAGALQDRKRAQLVGVKSFGKGTIQEAQDLEGGTGIHITVAKWLTPNGRWVNDTEGFEPDVVIEEDKDNPDNDLQLLKALELLE